MQIINEKIKELFGSQKLFCLKFGFSEKDFSKKKKTAENKIKWLNEFLKTLNLKVSITEINISDKYI